MEKAGCAINRDFFKVDRCDQPVLGGFRPDAGVVICHNNISCRTDMENMLTHELVHAYDHCRNKNMNWLDLKQHACSEIRASNLSGDCHWVRDPTLVPIRPRRRGGRRSLRTFAVFSLRPHHAFNPRPRRLPRRPPPTASPLSLSLSLSARRGETRDWPTDRPTNRTRSNAPTDATQVNEFFRGSLNVRNGHQKCVRRRAVLSTAMNPACESKAHAVEAVDAVFQTCFNDHRPFEDIP
jgi:hypothetical protein